VVAPVVETLMPGGREGGKVWVGGKFIEREGVNNWATGFFISFNTPFTDPNEKGVFKVPQAKDVEEFGMEFFPGEDTKKVYVMAYSGNDEGMHYGILESFDNRGVAEFDNRNRGDIWTGGQPVENAPGWWNSWWFGYYFKSENGWWYHADLGWIFPSGSVEGGMWIWKDGLNWVWTQENVYPFLYSSDRESWYYYFGGLNQKRMLFDYAEDRWHYLDDTGTDESKAEELNK